MLKNDKWIIRNAENGLIKPFVEHQVKEILVEDSDRETGHSKLKVLSYGTSSFGYDIRLSDKEFYIFRHIPGTVVNPKSFSKENLTKVDIQTDEFGEFFIIPAHSYGLGVALERLEVPNYITVICMGKSTYARCGIIVNVTPAEAEWRGNLTLEISNSSNADCRVYANEGIAQLLFLEGEPCKTSYKDRNGKYQGQHENVVVARL